MRSPPGDIFAGMCGALPSSSPNRVWILALAIAAALPLGACRARQPETAASFSDDFERAELGPNWNPTSPEYRIADGKLAVSNAHNHPAWLKQKLPRDVVLDIDATSKSPQGDLKVEIFGDGESFDPDRGAYTSTGYVLIFGGWRNTLSVICRGNEHDEGRKAERRDIKVEPGRSYHFTITRRGGTIDWNIDGKPFLSWTDPSPLAGAGHEFFAVDNWETEVTFDNLKFRPAP
jgi:hypothetical protein